MTGLPGIRGIPGQEGDPGLTGPPGAKGPQVRDPGKLHQMFCVRGKREILGPRGHMDPLVSRERKEVKV